MANYFIIGGDTKEYGPITEADIRLWISEGRLNAQSSARRESEMNWQPLGAFAEFAAAFSVTPPTITPLSGRASASTSSAKVNFAERDYELDIGGCITRGWELLKNNFGTLFLGFLAAMGIVAVTGIVLEQLVALVIPKGPLAVREVFHLLATALATPVVGPLMGGMYFLFLQINRGRSAEVGSIFTGFQRNFKDLFLGQLTVSFLVGLCLAPYTMASDAKVLPIVEQMRHASPNDVAALTAQLWPAIFSTLPLFFVCLIPVTYLTVNWQFTLALIIDKQMTFPAAMRASWTMVHKHWWQVFGLTLVIGLVSAAGAIGCCVGILVTIPIGIAAMILAYETIFGERQN